MPGIARWRRSVLFQERSVRSPTKAVQGIGEFRIPGEPPRLSRSRRPRPSTTVFGGPWSVRGPRARTARITAGHPLCRGMLETASALYPLRPRGFESLALRYRDHAIDLQSCLLEDQMSGSRSCHDPSGVTNRWRRRTAVVHSLGCPAHCTGQPADGWRFEGGAVAPGNQRRPPPVVYAWSGNGARRVPLTGI